MTGLDLLAWASLLFFVGILLLLVGPFLFPWGLGGLLAVLAVVAALVVAFQAGFVAGLLFTVGAATAGTILLRWGRKLFYAACGPMDPPEPASVAEGDPRQQLVGSTGIARSKMLPSGTVEIDGELVDAITQGRVVEAGSRVQVVEVRANRVVVRPVDP
jgi:membrane-bound ClpP family serine protease